MNDKKFFYKYYSAEATKLVLSNLTVKWSSPILFNDPFDLQVNINFDFDLNDLREPFLNEIEELMYSDEEPVGHMDHPLFALIMHSRRNAHKLSREEFREYMRPASDEGFKNSKKLLEDLEVWWRDFSNDLRLFCISEVNDDLLMWAHYADCHRGCVIKFNCLPQHDRPLCAAVKVNYQQEVPTIATMDNYLKHLTGQIKLNFDSLFTLFSTTKSKHWSYEKEWRCIGTKKSDSVKLYDFDPILFEEIAAIYMGCKITNKDKDDILSLLTGNLETVDVYIGKKDKYEYSLEFDKL